MAGVYAAVGFPHHEPIILYQWYCRKVVNLFLISLGPQFSQAVVKLQPTPSIINTSLANYLWREGVG